MSECIRCYYYPTSRTWAAIYDTGITQVHDGPVTTPSWTEVCEYANTRLAALDVLQRNPRVPDNMHAMIAAERERPYCSCGAPVAARHPQGHYRTCSGPGTSNGKA